MDPIPVNYDDFIKLTIEHERLVLIRELVEIGNEYCSDTIKVILGIQVNENGKQN